MICTLLRGVGWHGAIDHRHSVWGRQHKSWKRERGGEWGGEGRCLLRERGHTLRLSTPSTPSQQMGLLLEPIGPTACVCAQDAGVEQSALKIDFLPAVDSVGPDVEE